MFKRFAVIGFSYFSLIVVLLSLLKVNVAVAETIEISSKHEAEHNYNLHFSSIHDKSLLFDFSELLLLFEDGEEVDESDNEQETLTHLVLPFYYHQQEFHSQFTVVTSTVEHKLCCSKAVQNTFPSLHIKNCIFRI
jgi:hypothetical protein